MIATRKLTQAYKPMMQHLHRDDAFPRSQVLMDDEIRGPLGLMPESDPESILGDPGAASSGDGIFTGESLQQERESPWAFTPTERVPEAFENPLADWPFLANQKAGFQTRKNRGRSKTQEYTNEVLGRFVYCDGIYRTSCEVQCETVSCL